MNDFDHVEKQLACLGQTVASVLADMKLEIFALRQMLAERGTISQRELDQRVISLRDDKLPTLTASTSGDLQQRFEKLCRQSGI